MANLLIENGANIDAKNAFGCTPLLAALEPRHLANLEYVLDDICESEPNDRPPEITSIFSSTQYSRFSIWNISEYLRCQLIKIPELHPETGSNRPLP